MALLSPLRGTTDECVRPEEFCPAEGGRSREGLVLFVLVLCLYRPENINGKPGNIKNIAIITNSLSEHLHRTIQTNVLHKCPDQFNLTIKIQLRNSI